MAGLTKPGKARRLLALERKNPFPGMNPWMQLVWSEVIDRSLVVCKNLHMIPASRPYARIEDEALHLPLDERSKLASKLVESLDETDDAEISPEWREELRRRVADIDEGRAQLIPHDEVRERVKTRLEEIRRARPE